MGFNLYQFRIELRRDLKDSSTLWSNAELNRCIQRAVDDLSRFLPLEKVYEETLDFDIEDETLTTPAAASATYVVNAITLDGESDGSTLTISNTRINPPRRLTVTLTDANYSVTELVITVKGYDQDGHYIEESWSLPQLLVSGTAYQGKLYFSRVTGVILNKVGGSIAAGDTVSVGTGNAYDSYVFLANRPIKPGTETVTNAAGTTEYTRDTDYTMDYVNGAIKYINGGDMDAGTSYLIDYTKSKLGINIADLLPSISRIQRVEYPANQIPQQFSSFNIIGDFMYIASKIEGKSQEEMSSGSNYHIAIYYETKHSPPGESSPGSYPAVLDEVICIGASAYALLIKALQYEHQAITDAAYVDTALDKVATYLETNGTTDNALDVLANITDNITDLRTAVKTAVDAANAYLDAVSTTDLDASTPDSAVEALKKYEDKIDLVNIGASVGELGATYARAWTEIANARTSAALGYLQEAGQRLDNIRTHVEEAGGWNRMADTFVAEANSRISNVQSYLQVAERFRTEAIERRNEFHSILRDKSEYRKRVSSVPVRQPA